MGKKMNQNEMTAHFIRSIDLTSEALKDGQGVTQNKIRESLNAAVLDLMIEFIVSSDDPSAQLNELRTQVEKRQTMTKLLR